MSDRGYLSIGDALAMLLEEFPDITISKIRFLESQGMISPERTAAGYRMFQPIEVEKLRLILREQQRSFLPLRVIKGQLDDETSDISRELMLAADPEASVRNHPSRRGTRGSVDGAAPRDDLHVSAEPSSADEPRNAGSGRNRPRGLTRDVLMKKAQIDATHLGVLENAGLLTPRGIGIDATFGPESLDIARLSKKLVDSGIDVRHLKSWRLAVERLSDVLGQRLAPMMRQRNPEARQASESLLEEISRVGIDLFRKLMQQEVRMMSAADEER